jgi:hypothetical protein
MQELASEVDTGLKRLNPFSTSYSVCATGAVARV